MGTYLQGVQSIIPSIQPHDNGLNMVANLLQLKQSQYDSNYKQLNKMYGQFYYADLTRDDNIKRRDATVQQIDLDLKRIAGLDLSLEQNVQQASQIFKPFYEDGALMKDMAWTKNFNNTLGTAEGLLKSDDEKARKQYWDEGIRELQYRREEFKNATPEEAMGFGNVVYTPYVNVAERTRKLAKEAGLSYEKTSMSADGKWILKNKNGQLIIEPLSNLFEAELGRDPAVQAVYRTQAYVNRKDFAKGEAEKYGGEAQAEMEYMKDAYGKMKKLTENRHADKQANSKMYDAQIADIQKQIKEQGTDPLLERELQKYQEAKKVNDDILGKLDEQLNQFNSSYSSSGNTSTGEFKNPYKDVNQLRNVVDGNMANMLMNEDLMGAATRLAYTDAKEDFKENPYAVLDVKHAHQLSEINAAGSWRYQTEQLRGQNRLEAIQAKAYYDEFSYSGEPKAPKSSGGSKSGSGSGKKVSDEQVAQAQEILNNPLANQQAITEAKSVLKKHEEQQEFNVFDAFKLLDPEGGFLKGQDVSKVEKQSIGTLFDQKGKTGIMGLLKVYDQAIQNDEMTQQQFYDLVKPAGAKEMKGGFNVLKRENLPDPAFTSPKEMMKKIESEGVDFLLKHTNKESQDVMIKNYKGEKVRDAMDVERKKFAGYKEGTVKYSDNIKDNYMASFLANGTSWLTKNSNLTTVKSAMRQGLDTELAIANTISKNVQDSRKWRYETRELVADDVYNSLKNDPTMIREFGTAKFDKNGKYISTDMSRLREELGNMYDQSGNLNPNYKLKTNFIIEAKDKEQKMRNDPSFKMLPNFAQNALLSGLYEDRPETYKYKEKMESTNPVAKYQLGIGEDRERVANSIEDVNNILSARIMNQFTKSARDIYSDVGDRHIIGEVPGYVKLNEEGGSGFGMRALSSRIDLSKPNSLGAITFWEFTKDWANLRNSIDGLENVISFEGASPTGYQSGKIAPGIFGTSFFDRSYDETSSALGKRLLDDYMEWTKEHGTKANAFDMIAQRVAAEDMTKGSMKIKFPEKFLKEMLLDEEKNPNGYIEQADYDKLIQNGLTVIAPNTKFNNSLHNATMSPLQSHVEYNDKYTWNHPSGLGSFTIRKGDPSDPDYITETTYKDYNGEIIESVVNRSTTFGPNLESALGSGIDDLNGWVYDDLKKFSQQQKNIQMQSLGNAQK
jgi:hypothetical protein